MQYVLISRGEKWEAWIHPELPEEFSFRVLEKAEKLELGSPKVMTSRMGKTPLVEVMSNYENASGRIYLLSAYSPEVFSSLSKSVYLVSKRGKVIYGGDTNYVGASFSGFSLTEFKNIKSAQKTKEGGSGLVELSKHFASYDPTTSTYIITRPEGQAVGGMLIVLASFLLGVLGLGLVLVSLISQAGKSYQRQVSRFRQQLEDFITSRKPFSFNLFTDSFLRQTAYQLNRIEDKPVDKSLTSIDEEFYPTMTRRLQRRLSMFQSRVELAYSDPTINLEALGEIVLDFQKDLKLLEVLHSADSHIKRTLPVERTLKSLLGQCSTDVGLGYSIEASPEQKVYSEERAFSKLFECLFEFVSGSIKMSQSASHNFVVHVVNKDPYTQFQIALESEMGIRVPLSMPDVESTELYLNWEAAQKLARKLKGESVEVSSGVITFAIPSFDIETAMANQLIQQAKRNEQEVLKNKLTKSTGEFIDENPVQTEVESLLANAVTAESIQEDFSIDNKDESISIINDPLFVELNESKETNEGNEVVNFEETYNSEIESKIDELLKPDDGMAAQDLVWSRLSQELLDDLQGVREMDFIENKKDDELKSKPDQSEGAKSFESLSRNSSARNHSARVNPANSTVDSHIQTSVVNLDEVEVLDLEEFDISRNETLI